MNLKLKVSIASYYKVIALFVAGVFATEDSLHDFISESGQDFINERD